MPYTINLGEWNDIFAVPRSVVNKHIKLAKEDYVKVLLVVLASSGKMLDEDKISELCGVSPKNVADALLYWENCNIIKACEDGVYKPSEQEAEVKKAKEVVNAVEVEKAEVKTHSVAKNVKIKTSAPIAMTSFEISKRIESTTELKWVVSEAERLFGRFLTPSETSVLVTMFDLAKVPADVIVMAIEYCVSIEKANVRTVEKTAYSWIDLGFDTHQKVEAHIKELTTQKNNESLIKTAFGIWDHNLTTKQKQFIATWINEWEFSIEMIKLAYEKCVDNTGKLSFPYIDKILSKWKEAGLSTSEQVEAHEKARQGTGKGSGSSSLDVTEFEDWSSYTVPDLSNKS